MPEIQIPQLVITAIQVILAFSGAFFIALWVSLVIWTFRDARQRSRDVFAIMLATLMVVVFGPLGLILYFLLRPPVTLAELYERSLEEEALLQDLEERPRCPGCSRQVHEEWTICPDCHTTLKKICPECEKSLSLRWNICPFCGTHVSTPMIATPEYQEAPLPISETRPMSAVPSAYERSRSGRAGGMRQQVPQQIDRIGGEVRRFVDSFKDAVKPSPPAGERPAPPAPDEGQDYP